VIFLFIPHDAIKSFFGMNQVPFFGIFQIRDQNYVSIDLPGGRSTMTGSDDDAPAARGPPLGARARRPEGRESSCA
jgi:hypothetical protein